MAGLFGAPPAASCRQYAPTPGRGVPRAPSIAHPFEQAPDLGFPELGPPAALEVRRQGYDAETRPHQPAHLQAEGLEHAPHDAIAAFAHDYAIPPVPAFAAFRLENLEPRVSVGEPDAAL